METKDIIVRKRKVLPLSRGGSRPRTATALRKRDGQKRLIAELIRINGGYTEFAKKVSAILGRPIPRQHIINWRNSKSGIPLKYCLTLGVALQCSHYALNYRDLRTFYQCLHNNLTWEDAVNSCSFFSQEVRDRILLAKAPEIK
jgi:hypothetical protein